MSEYEYDMLVIGSGPAGQKAAIQAGKLGKRVGLIDLNPRIGGVCLHDGTIPSKSFREAILHLSGYKLWNRFGRSYRLKSNVQMEDLTRWSGEIIDATEETLRAQLVRNNVEIICGWASFESAHYVEVRQRNKHQTLSAANIVVATGTSARRPPGFEFDGRVIVDSNGILGLESLPRSLCIVGGGVIGSEYGSMFAALGVDVTIIEAKPSILVNVDSDIRDHLVQVLKRHRATILVNEKVMRCKIANGRAVVLLESGKRMVSDALLVSAGRVGNTEGLNLERIGVSTAPDGTIPVNDDFQTQCPNVYAVGDVSGVSSLASTAIEQGRRAACHAFQLCEEFPKVVMPYGIYSIPEIAQVGPTEAQLTASKIPYEVGIARFTELERGKIAGDVEGLLKIIFHQSTHEILAVHVIGECATEIIHIGQLAVAQKLGLESLVHMVFNYPSFSQAYKVAALDGFNKVVATRGVSFDEETVEEKPALRLSV